MVNKELVEQVYADIAHFVVRGAGYNILGNTNPVCKHKVVIIQSGPIAFGVKRCFENEEEAHGFAKTLVTRLRKLFQARVGLQPSPMAN